MVRVPLPGSGSAVLVIDRADPANRLGAGGSGVVFKACHVSKSGSRDHVAVKTLPFGATPAELETFRKEVGLLRRVALGWGENHSLCKINTTIARQHPLQPAVSQRGRPPPPTACHRHSRRPCVVPAARGH